MAVMLRIAAATAAVGILVLAAGPTIAPAAVRPIVTAVNIRGNVRITADKIAPVVKTQPGAPYDPKQVAADQTAILGLGYFSDVKSDVRNTPGGVAVTFIVIENPVVSKINFSGNEHVTSDILTALMDTAPGQVLNTNTLRDDVQKINSYYDRLGYIGTRHVQNIRIQNSGTVDIAVKEGVTVTAVNVTGNVLVPTPAILGSIKTKPGTTFSESTFNDDLQKIQQLYKDVGFSVEVDGAPDADHPGVINVSVCEVKVGAVEIVGNSKTKDYVIRRLLRLRPGDYVSDSRLRYDYEQLNNTQFFKTVDLSTKPFGEKCGFVTLVWTVVEQRTGTAGAGVSYGGGGQYGQGISGNVYFSETNLNGTGDAASLNLQRGQHVSQVNLSGTIPYIHKFKPDSISMNFFNNIVSDQPYPVYKEAGNNPFFSVSPSSGGGAAPLPPGTTGGQVAPCAPGSTPCSGIFANYSSTQSGISVSFGHPIAYFTRLNLGAAVTRLGQQFVANGFPQSLLDLSSAVLAPTSGIAGGPANQTGHFALHSLTSSLVRDNRDDVVNPRFGGTSSISEELAARAFGSDYVFSKTDLDYTRFWPFRRHSTLALHLNYGFSSGGRSLPYNDLFSLSDQQLRGIRFVYYGDREALAQTELRIPVTADKKFGVAFFAETGDAPYITALPGPTPVPTPTPPSGPHAPPAPPVPLNVTYTEATFHLKTDVGFGIRVSTPVLPQMIRIDFATGSQGAHVSFGLGQPF